MLQWETVKSAFDQNKEMPYDIEEIITPYDEETTIKMFNDFVSNDSNQSYEKAQYGGLTKFPDGGEQEDGPIKPYVTSNPKEFAFRNKMYNDSLSLYNASQKTIGIRFPKISEEKFNEIVKKNDELPAYIFDKKQHLEDKKNKKEKPLSEYVVKTTHKNMRSEPAFIKNKVLPTVFGDPNKFAIPLKDGTIKIPLYVIGDKPEFSQYTIYDPSTGSRYDYQENFWSNKKKPTLLGVSSDNIQPVSTNYFGEDFPTEYDSFNITEESQVNGKTTSNLNNEYKNFFYHLAAEDVYAKPVQPVEFLKTNDSQNENSILPIQEEKVNKLSLKPIERFTFPEQTILPGKPYVKPYKPRYGVLAGDEDLDLSSNATQEQIAAKRRQKDAEDWLRKTQEYQNKQRNFAEGGENHGSFFNPKFEGGGGTEYTYSGRPDSRYKKIKNQWYINNSTTGGNFVPIEDPTGQRTATLNTEAVISNSSYANRPKSYMSSRLPDMLPSETTQMFKPITQNAVMDFTNNMNKGFDKQHANISRASQAIKENVKSIQSNKNYTKKQKDELIKNEYARLLDYDKRTDLENAGAWLNNHDATHFVQAGGSEPKTAGDYAERTWDIITNPFDAAKYSISGGGLENMPWQYNTLKDLGYDPSAQSYQERFSGSEGKSNLVGDALNSFNLFDAGDKVYRNAEKGNWSDAGLEALRFLEVGAFMKPGMLGKLGKVARTNPADYLTELANSKYVDRMEGYLNKKLIDIGNPIDNLVQSLKGRTNASDLERKLRSLKLHPDYEDLSKGEKAFDKVKNESLEFWKTPEGKRRVQLYLDENNLTEQGITPEMYSDMMSDVNFTSPSKVKNTRGVQKEINKEREALRRKKYEVSQEIQRLEKELTRDTTLTKQVAESNVSKIDELTKRLEDLNTIDEGHLQSLNDLTNYPTNNAHYAPRDSEVFIGEDFVKPSNLDQTVGHEWGHSKHLHPHMKLQESFPGYFDELGVDIMNPIGKSRPLNIRLRDNLDFENRDIDVVYSDLPEHLQSINFKKLYKNAQPVSGTGVDRFTDPEEYWKNSAGYFRHNDEANAYLQELVPELINRGMIEKFGDHIDPQMIDELFKQYRTESANKIIEPVRLLDIVKPTAKSIQNITNELNDLHIIAPVGVGLGSAAAYESLNEQSPSTKNLKFGGNIGNLQKFIK
jgi:hypothetical protein